MEGVCHKIVFVIDSSGSMNDVVNRIYSEFKKLMLRSELDDEILIFNQRRHAERKQISDTIHVTVMRRPTQCVRIIRTWIADRCQLLYTIKMSVFRRQKQRV